MTRLSPYLAAFAFLPAAFAPGPALAQPAPASDPVAAPDPGSPAPETSPVPAPAATPTPPGPALAPTPLGRPLIQVERPDPGPPAPRSYHLHDGFYFRANVGLATARTFVSTDSVTHPKYSVSGGGIALDLLVGGTPSVGLSLGGALSLQSFGHGSGSSAGLGLLGAFVDGFPNKNGGLHLGGLLGLAASRTNRPSDVDELKAAGFGMSAWIGHDWWVADDWSMGGLLRLSGALTKDDSHDSGPDPVELDSSTYELALLFTVLYH